MQMDLRVMSACFVIVARARAVNKSARAHLLKLVRTLVWRYYCTKRLGRSSFAHTERACAHLLSPDQATITRIQIATSHHLLYLIKSNITPAELKDE